MKSLLMTLLLPGTGLLAFGGSVFTRTDLTPAAWDNASTWLEGESAGYPDQAGCEVWLTSDVTKGTTTTTLSGTRTIGAMVMHQSANMDGNFEAEQDKTCTLVLDSGAVGKPCCISNAPTDKFQSSISLGKYGTADGSFTIRLASVLEADLNARHRCRLFLAGKVTGGTPESPVGITLGDGYGDGWYFRAITLTNPDNDFVGDIHIGADGKDNKFTVVGAGYYNDCPGYNSILGAASNEIYLHGGESTLAYKRMNGNRGDYLARTIHGTGIVRGGEIDPWGSFPTEELYIGGGARLDPCNLAADSSIGKIKVQASRIVSDGDWKLVFDVGETGNDVIEVADLGNAFMFGGKIVIRDLGEVAPGTVFDLMTVNAGAGVFSFVPSEKPVDYSFAVKRTDAGWTVSATKLLDPTLYPSVAAADPSLIGDTYATVGATVVSLAPSGTGVVRVYRETVTEGSVEPVRTLVASKDVSATGDVSFRLDGLTVGETYSFRFSVETTDGEFFSWGLTQVTPRALTAPEEFFELVGAAESNLANPDIWTHGNYDRHSPSCPGDTVKFDLEANNASRTLSLSQDASIGTISTINGMDNGKAITFEAAAETTPVLHLAAADEGGTAKIIINSDAKKRFVNFNFGSAVTTDLEVALDNPLEVTLFNNRGHTVCFNSPVSGGTAVRPCPLKVIPGNANGYCDLTLALMNANNSFVGDVFVGDKTTAASTEAKLALGSTSVPFADGMLGASANQVRLANGKMTVYTGEGESAEKLTRRVSGWGTISTEYNTSKHNAYPLTLGDGFVLDIDSAQQDLQGKMKIVSSALTVEPEAEFIIAVDAESEACEQVNFNVYDAEVILSGRVRLDPTASRGYVGRSWPIMTVGANGTAQNVTCRLKTASDAPRARYYVSGDSKTGWKVFAEAQPPALIIIVR